MATDPELIDPNDPYPAHPPPQRPVTPIRGSVDFTAPLTSLALAVRVLLAATVALNIALVPALLRQRSTMQDFVAGSATVGDVHSADDAASTLSNAALAAFALTAVGYLVWFYRARTNVEHYEPRFQRRSRGWALGGWLPVVSLWVPYQVTTDILLDSRQSLRGSVDVRRRSFGLVQAWWAAWLVRYAFYVVDRLAHSDTPHHADRSGPDR